MQRSSVLLTTFLAMVSISCTDSSSGPEPIRIKQDTEEVAIVDQTGKRWDVTHAKVKYGFDPDKFQFGLGPNAIPPIMQPEMLSPGELGYPTDYQEFFVLGTSLNGHTRAYPLYIMKSYEIANEQFGEAHVAVAYWPLVDLAAVYSREIDGKTLTLSASGWTYNYTFVLFDYETESLWYHLPSQDGLTCINGHYADRKLEEFNATKARWNTWRKEHPDTKFLDETSVFDP